MSLTHWIGLRLLPAALCLGLVACSTPIRLDAPAPVDDRNAPGSRTPADHAAPDGTATPNPTPSADAPGGAPGEAPGASRLEPPAVREVRLDDSAVPASLRVLYFDLDSFVIRSEYQAPITGLARSLAADRSRGVRVEGHTDARGGREYNLALGQKRADAVARALRLAGAQDQQLETVTYGQERPAADGQDEAAWARNRRVEIKDR